MKFLRQEYWSGLPFPSPKDLPNPGIEAGSLGLQADSLPSEPPGEAHGYVKRENFWEDSKKEIFISTIVILWVSLVVQQ